MGKVKPMSREPTNEARAREGKHKASTQRASTRDRDRQMKQTRDARVSEWARSSQRVENQQVRQEQEKEDTKQARQEQVKGACASKASERKDSSFGDQGEMVP
jgi:hypothetical protein